jgi:hypothetical protein
LAADTRVPARASRFRLYLPFGLLALLALGWSIGWFVMRGRIVAGMDEWLAAEAAAGRRWTCRDRSIGGYPFRLELSCASLSFQRADATAHLGRVLAVAQVYNPKHIIIEAQGPLRVTSAATNAEAEWRALRASVVFTSAALGRLAVAAEEPVLRMTGPTTGRVDLSARTLQLHARPDPADATSAELALAAAGAVVPGLDALIGGAEPADLDVAARVTKTADLPARPVAGELERWRLAGGEVQVSRANLVKGPRRVQAQGSGGLDEAHRPRGQVQASALGIEGLLGRFVGDKAGLAGSLLGALFGPPPAEIRQPQGAQDPNAPRLKPLPPLRFENGRMYVGPLAVPGVRLPPLY